MKHLILSLLLFFSVSAAMANAGYTRKYQALAQQMGAQYGIPAKLILAVAIVESGAGTSRSSRLLNNHFGIVGKNGLMSSHGIKTMYKQYGSVEESCVDFCKLLARKKYYAQLKGNQDTNAWILAISKAGYSTHPEVWRMRIQNTVSVVSFE